HLRQVRSFAAEQVSQLAPAFRAAAAESIDVPGVHVAYLAASTRGTTANGARSTTTRSPGRGRIACQPRGKEGGVQANSQDASARERLTHPCVKGDPNPSCQNAPCRASAPWYASTKGTSSMCHSSGRRPTISWCTDLSQTRKTPWSVGMSALPVDTRVAKTRRVPW